MVTVRDINLIVPAVMVFDKLKPFKSCFATKAWGNDPTINLARPWGYCIRTHKRWEILIRKGTDRNYETLREETMDGIDRTVIKRMPACNLLIGKNDYQAFAQAFAGIEYFVVNVHHINDTLKGHAYIN